MLPVKRTIKNNKFLYRQPCYGWRYFMLLVYGHNMKDGSMFQGLHAYEDSQYLEKHPYVYIHANRKDNVQNLCVYCI